MKKGIWITFEGPDGSGKDTVIDGVRSFLQEQNRDYVIVKDPSPDVAPDIRNLLLFSSDLTPKARLLLHLAARAELLEKQIVPALQEGKVVLGNRFDLSTYAYQGEYFSFKEIEAISKASGLMEVRPDLQLVLISQQSFRNTNENVMDEFCEAYRKKIIARYVELAGDADRKAYVMEVDEKDQQAVLADALSRLVPLI
jgi:dTMP kinase